MNKASYHYIGIYNSFVRGYVTKLLNDLLLFFYMYSNRSPDDDLNSQLEPVSDRVLFFSKVYSLYFILFTNNPKILFPHHTNISRKYKFINTSGR